jgi:hypothetical protein
MGEILEIPRLIYTFAFVIVILFCVFQNLRQIHRSPCYRVLPKTKNRDENELDSRKTNVVEGGKSPLGVKGTGDVFA